MTFRKLLITLVLATGLYSCGQKDEPANVEAEIINFSLPKTIQRSSDVANGLVNVFVRRTEGDIMEVTPTIEVSKGASISPASGQTVQFIRSTIDTSEYVAHYTVTSENKQSVKDYKVTLIPPIRLYTFPFDSWDTIRSGSTRYCTPTDTKWATGNSAVSIYLSTRSDPSTFPSVPVNTAVSGRAARLQTITGAPVFGAPIAAGNLFWGIFKSDNLLADKLTFTRFGQPFDQKPKTLKGFYQYKAGPKFTDKNEQEVPGRVDSCFMYGILYETDEDGATLDGRNIQTSERIVAKALGLQYSTPTEGSGYVPFSIDFVYNREPDFINKLYKLTIVFTSSKSGGLFEGAVGSTLLVDEVSLECFEE